MAKMTRERLATMKGTLSHTKNLSVYTRESLVRVIYEFADALEEAWDELEQAKGGLCRDGDLGE